MWHLSYVAIGAAVAPSLSLWRLGWTLVVFFLGLGIAAHALDEVNGRPLGTGFGDLSLWVMAAVAFACGGVIVALGLVSVSPWLAVWAAAGLALAIGYPLEWPPFLHTDLGFAVAWGAYPALAGYWVQAETVTVAAVAVAGFAVLSSLAQRALSTPARFVRRSTESAAATFDDATWDRRQLLATWERPLRWLTWAVVALAAGLVLTRI
jgi:hypothetical protein